MIGVLVVEDDFRVAGVHAAFTEQVSGFKVIGTARTAAQARAKVAELKPDLVLLDTYLPDQLGIELLADLRVDAIMLTAASDAGALNYLVKPFTAADLAARLTAYARYRGLLTGGDKNLDQDEIDRALRVLHDGDKPSVPKGQSPVTARLVADALRSADGSRSAAEIAAQLGIGRATAQRYLAALAADGTAAMGLRYGTTGRPEHEYAWRG